MLSWKSSHSSEPVKEFKSWKLKSAKYQRAVNHEKRSAKKILDFLFVCFQIISYAFHIQYSKQQGKADGKYFQPLLQANQKRNFHVHLNYWAQTCIWCLLTLIEGCNLIFPLVTHLRFYTGKNVCPLRKASSEISILLDTRELDREETCSLGQNPNAR